MIVDREKLFFGMPVSFESINIYSPSIKKIVEIGSNTYAIYAILATFNKDRISSMFQLDGVEQTSDYRYIVSGLDGNLGAFIAEALTFFIRKTVHFNFIDYCFYVDDRKFLHEGNYLEFVDAIKSTNCIGEEKENLPKFRNETARKLYEKVLMSKKNDNSGLELKDILSILCNASDNGLNVFNIRNLTIYQIYEHWERFNMKEGYKRLHPVWANGHLEDSSKLKEWIVKTKL